MKFNVIFIIQGKEFPVEVNKNQAIISAVRKALKASGNQGPIEGWTVTFDGQRLDIHKGFEDYGITQTVKLFLNKSAGRGG